MVESRSLSDVEEKILRTLAERGSHRLSPSVLAEEVGCKLQTIFSALQDDYFRSLWNATLQKTTSAAVPAILNVVEGMALEGDFKHAKLLLEIAGVYTPKSQTEVKANIQLDENPFTDPEKRKKFLERLVNAGGDEAPSE